MSQMVMVDKNTLDDIISGLKRLEKRVKKLEPYYGEISFLDKETIKALEEYKRGKTKKFDNVDELIADLKA